MRHLYAILVFSVASLSAAFTTHAGRIMPTVPTTKILAIGTLTAPLSPDEIKNIMPNEVRDTVELYLNGKIDQWWFRQDGNGIVLLLNVTSTEEASSLLEKLPLGFAKRMKFQLMPLGPLAPLQILLRQQSTKQP